MHEYDILSVTTITLQLHCITEWKSLLSKRLSSALWYYKPWCLFPVSFPIIFSLLDYKETDSAMMLLTKKTKKQAASSKENRILISVTVIGSPGPIRLVVNQEELVAAVIDAVLKYYARIGRFPILGTNRNSFFLYCPASGAEGNNNMFSVNCKVVVPLF